MENNNSASEGTSGKFISEDKQKEIIKKFSFHGESSVLFRIYIVNALFTVLTLGLYYPWAKAKLMQYNYGESEFMGSRFVFHGTGREMFKGFIRAALIIGVVYVLMMLLQYWGFPGLSVLLFLAGIVAILPLVIYGTVRYRAARSSWRGIYFQYVGTLGSMYKVVGLGMLYTVLSLGIYAHWLRVDIYKEVLGNLRLGNIRFKFTGDGGYYFSQALIGGLLMYITLGIYYFKMQANIFNFSVSNIRMHQDHLQLKGTLKAEVTGMDMFQLKFINLLIIICTLGLATPLAIVRTMNFYAEKITVRGSIQFDQIVQEKVDLKSGSVAEGLFDALDMDLQII